MNCLQSIQCCPFLMGNSFTWTSPQKFVKQLRANFKRNETNERLTKMSYIYLLPFSYTNKFSLMCVLWVACTFCLRSNLVTKNVFVDMIIIVRSANLSTTGFRTHFACATNQSCASFIQVFSTTLVTFTHHTIGCPYLRSLVLAHRPVNVIHYHHHVLPAANPPSSISDPLRSFWAILIRYTV